MQIELLLCSILPLPYTYILKVAQACVLYIFIYLAIYTPPSSHIDHVIVGTPLVPGQACMHAYCLPSSLSISILLLMETKTDSVVVPFSLRSSQDHDETLIANDAADKSSSDFVYQIDRAFVPTQPLILPKLRQTLKKTTAMGIYDRGARLCLRSSKGHDKTM